MQCGGGEARKLCKCFCEVLGGNALVKLHKQSIVLSLTCWVIVSLSGTLAKTLTCISFFPFLYHIYYGFIHLIVMSSAELNIL